MEINQQNNGQGVEPAISQIKESDTSVNAQPKPEQPSMDVLLGEEGLGLDFPKQGEIRTGVIASMGDNEILVSIGTKSEGVIAGRELEVVPPEERANFDVGAEIPVYVLLPEDSNGNVVLSYMRAREEKDWERVNELLESAEPIETEIVGYNKGGLLVPLGRLRGFVPASQISMVRRAALNGDTPDQRWGKMVGEPVTVRVIEVDRERRRLILSERLALQETRETLKDRLLDELNIGDVRDGRVTSIAEFGAFVNIEGADGLVHLSEISWDRIQHPNELLKVGQEVQVKVISIDHDKKRIGLSIRQLQDDPWVKKVDHLKEGQLVEGKITHLTKFGAFARLSEDLEGLIHLSEISEQRIAHPKEVVKEGDQVTLRIIKIDPERRRIALSMRKVDSPAYADLDWKMALATEVEGVQLVEGQEVTQPVEEKAIEEPQAPESAEEPQTPDAAEESQVSESVEGPQVVEVAEEPQAAEVATELEQPGETTEVQASAEENQSTNAGTGEDEEAMTPSTESNVQE
jgi:small subunit ribosomal protein S1